MIALALLLAAVPTKIAFTNAAGSVGTGACSPPVTLEARDDANAPVQVSSATTVLLTGPGAIFPASGCSAAAIDPQGGLQIPAGASSVTFRFISPDTGTATLGATVGTLTASQSWTVTPAAGEPVNLAFTAPPPALDPGACSPAIPFQIRDVNDAPATLDRNVEVSFGPTGFIEVYDNAACSGTHLLSRSFAAGAAPQGQVFIRTNVTGQIALQATSPGLHTGSLPLTLAAPQGGGCSTGAGSWLSLAPLLFAALRRRRA